MVEENGSLKNGRRENLSRRRLVAAAFGAATILAGRVPAAAQEAGRGGTKTGEELARTGLKYKGSPYVAAGNTPRGFDCSGFTQFVVKKVTKRDIGRTVTGQWQQGSPVAKGKWRAGDLVFFKNTYDRGLSHVGIYVGNGRFVHAANEQTGVIVSELGSDYYAGHYKGARRLA